MVTDITTEDVKAFSYQYNNETLSFVKEDDTWYYEADKSIALDQDAVETLVTTAAQLTADQVYTTYQKGIADLTAAESTTEIAE